MRPQRLELSGFATFREPVEVDFAEANLVAFVGPTGAGKSSILDGIGFALFGSVARLGRANAVAPIVNQQSNEARVRLDFEVSGATYTAVRVVRRTASGATTKEARLERGDEVLAGSAPELDAAIHDLLGLTFDQFTKTVMLPQGDFARFLNETPKERQALLRRLLGMELFSTIGQASRQRASEAKLRHEVLTEQRTALPDIDMAAMKDLAKHHRSLTKLVTKADKLDEKWRTGEEKLTPLVAQLSDVNQAIESLIALAVPDDTASLTAQIDAQTLEVDTGRREVETAEIVLGLAEFQELVASISKAEGALTAAQDQLDLAGNGAQEAKKALDEARRSLDRAQLEHAAASVAEALSVGSPCPVCDQIVDAVPRGGQLAHLDQHRRELDDATKLATDALDAVQHQQVEVARLETGLAALLRDQKQIEVDIELPSDRPATKALSVAKATKQLSAATGAHTKAKRAFDNLVSAEAEQRRRFVEARDTVSQWKPPTPKGESLSDDWEQLLDWAAKQQASLEKKQSKLHADIEKKHAAQDALAEQLTSVGVAFEGPGDHTAVAQWLQTQQDRAAVSVERAQELLDQLASLDDQIAAASETQAVAAELGKLLSARRFEQWLLRDAMETLAERASQRLLELTSGAFSLVAEADSFGVRDHRNADEVRSSRTLSGGETFLTSLSLALALADSISELATTDSARIESMFLDEGFGTLDDETLDVVASTLEELGSSGRLIGVVTHIPTLADRLPTAFVVARSTTGSTITRRDG